MKFVDKFSLISKFFELKRISFKMEIIRQNLGQDVRSEKLHFIKEKSLYR